MSRRDQKKIPQATSPKGARIPTPPLRPQRVRFSFEFVDVAHEKFCLDKCPEGYLGQLLEKLKAISGMAAGDLRDRSISRVLHSHAIDFARTSERAGFAHIRQETWDGRAWQFALTVNEHGRVHGFLDNDVFYVVWLDPKHLLWD
ncbi:MAG: hypothetical protein SH850_11700 [Planctomycetaceae bacterium]|nr:hypothetical protein [Planctomycetaceae bacterium]